MSDILVITGLSGAGRSQTANDLEDLGWFVVDNLPVTLVPKIVELGAGGGAPEQHLGLVVGPLADQGDLLDELDRLRSGGHRVRLLFLDATTPELVKRYGSTRRKHPLDEGQSSIVDAIEHERALLEPVKAAADLVIDTSELTVHELKARIVGAFAADGAAPTMRTSVVSFGFKQGPPLDVDLILDVRFLPNPHWDEVLRPQCGLDEAVRDFVLGQPLTDEFLRRWFSLLELLVPAYAAEGKSYLTIAIGCTGGQHRSVVIAEELATWLRSQGYEPQVSHRDCRR